MATIPEAFAVALGHHQAGRLLEAEGIYRQIVAADPDHIGSLTMLAGPERIEAGWWDDALAARDYYIARNDSQMLLWVYRERPTLAEETPDWFLHGFFG